MGEINKMGQRFQIIVKTPAEKYSVEDNPNDKLGSVYIYHCQWLWGNFAIWRGGNIIKGIKELLKEQRKHNKKNGFTGINYQDIIGKTIKWVCYKDLHSQNNIDAYFEKGESYLFEKNEDWLELINTFDNNNGVLLIEITEEDKIKYAFINPYDNEGSNYENLLDYKTYLKDYKNEKERKSFEKDKEYQGSITQFESSILLNEFPTIKDWMRKKE